MDKIKKLMKYRNLILISLDIFCIIFAYYIGTVFYTGKFWNWEQYYVFRSTRSAIISIVQDMKIVNHILNILFYV